MWKTIRKQIFIKSFKKLNMKKFLFLFATLLIVAVSCNVDSTPTTELIKEAEAKTRNSQLTLNITFNDRSTAVHNADVFIIEEEVDGVKITINPGSESSLELSNVSGVFINNGTFKVTRSNGTVYLNKTYLAVQNASSGFNVNLNPGSINFNEPLSIIGD
jgi:hypothetical protein